MTNIRNSLAWLVRAWLAMMILALDAAAAPQLPEPELAWKNVEVNGRKTAVFSIVRDSRGLVWMGTNSGLHFYDGVTTHSVGADSPQIGNAQVYAIVESDSLLLLGSNNGLLTYNLSTGQMRPWPQSTPKEIRTLLLADRQLWIGSLNGIARIDLAANDSAAVDLSAGLPHRSVYSLLRDSRGILYAGTYDGLARWSEADRRFRPIGRPMFVNCMIEAPDQEHIYIGGEGFLLKYSPLDNSWQPVDAARGTNVKSLARADDGRMLAGTDNGIFDLGSQQPHLYRHDSRQEQSLADNEIWCLLTDSTHNVWAGHERGFSIASNSSALRTIKLSSLVESGEGNEIHTIHRDAHNNLWLAGTNGIIRIADGSAPRWYRHSQQPHSLSHNRIRAIHEDSSGDGSMWFTTDAGINRLNPQADGFDIYHVTDSAGEHGSNWVYALVEDGDSLWVGGFLNGIHRVARSQFTPGGAQITADLSLNSSATPHLSNDLVNDALLDRDGNLWILLFRDNSLARYEPQSRTLHEFDIYELTGGYPSHIALDTRGRIWCAIQGGALIFNSDGTSTAITFPPTNSDESVRAMGRVGDGMWISTQSNVWSINGSTLEASLMPIPQKAYTAIYDDSAAGKIYLGATDEIVVVDSDGIASTPADHNAIQLIISNQPGSDRLDLSEVRRPVKSLTIPYGGGVTLVVGTLDYSPESVQRYMYRLAKEPTDTAGPWVIMPEGANTITFSDLKMGSYSLLVKTVGTPGTPTIVSLRVSPPWMLTWWAFAIYGLILTAIVTAIVAEQRRRTRREFAEQERRRALENVEKKLTFLSDISHDLKTPLSMILGPVSLMKERARDPESRRSLTAVYDNAVRLNNMIHRTLELQQLDDTDESLMILSTFDVVAFCRGIFDVFEENNPQKKFVFHSACERLFIKADAVKLESVMTNLISNACKYSQDDATISCGISLGADERVQIIVSDDGMGIADADQQLVFQRMFRSPSTAKLKEGTGLGLYLIKKYLEMMGGNIDLYSRQGEGTSFIVTLPAAVASAELVTAATPSGGEEGRQRVLIVEDNAEIASFVTQLLRDDYAVLTAENGRAGLAIASSFQPDLIIADEMMPIMTGLEMVKRLKQNPRLSTIPIIMLTAKGDHPTETQSLKLGVDAFMLKPFEPAALLARISNLLQARSELRERLRIQTLAEAEQRPIEAESVSEKQFALIARTIEDNIADPDLNVNLLCEKSGIANKQLYRLIKKYLGMAPLDYIRSIRLQKAAVLLSQHRFTVAEISYMVGFKTPSYFAKCFQAQFGVKPSLYRSDDEPAP